MNTPIDTRTSAPSKVLRMPGDPPSLFAWLCVAQIAVIIAMILV